MPADKLMAYTGRYSAAAHDIDIVAGDGEGMLVMLEIPKGGFPTADSPPPPADPPVRLAFVEDDHVLALDPPIQGRQADFLRDAEGRSSGSDSAEESIKVYNPGNRRYWWMLCG